MFFFRMIPDIDHDIDMFWNKNENKFVDGI